MQIVSRQQPTSKDYTDPREQAVFDPTSLTREQQEARIAAVERVGHVVTNYGVETAMGWAGSNQESPIAPLVDEFGRPSVERWIRYFAWKEGLA